MDGIKEIIFDWILDLRSFLYFREKISKKEFIIIAYLLHLKRVQFWMIINALQRREALVDNKKNESDTGFHHYNIIISY